MMRIHRAADRFGQAYAGGWIKNNQSDCSHRDRCRGSGDLHNLWPSIGCINNSRNNLPFGEIDDQRDKWRFKKFCDDYERTKRSEGDEDPMVEPRDRAKGDIARSILYMMDEYGLPVPEGMDCRLLLKWHEEDPPDDHERWRNDEILRLQGNMNHWISGTEGDACKP